MAANSSQRIGCPALGLHWATNPANGSRNIRATLQVHTSAFIEPTTHKNALSVNMNKKAIQIAMMPIFRWLQIYTTKVNASNKINVAALQFALLKINKNALFVNMSHFGPSMSNGSGNGSGNWSVNGSRPSLCRVASAKSIVWQMHFLHWSMLPAKSIQCHWSPPVNVAFSPLANAFSPLVTCVQCQCHTIQRLLHDMNIMIQILLHWQVHCM